jgi:hypothetical protein
MILSSHTIGGVIMTPERHYLPRIIIALITGVIVGFITQSWWWGSGSFAIAIFLVVWVAGWVYGSLPKGEIVIDDELGQLLHKLETIGRIKDELALSERGWYSILGLYVLLRETGGVARLQAGEKEHIRVDATIDYSKSGSRWFMSKLERGDWERLINPTLDIAVFLDSHAFKGSISEEDTEALKKAITMFQDTGECALPT